jgi:hypothetical protein
MHFNDLNMDIKIKCIEEIEFEIEEKNLIHGIIL